MRDGHLIHQYRLLDADIARYDDWLNGSGECETQLFIPDPKDRPQAEKKLAALEDRRCALPAPDGVFEIVKSHLEDFILKLKADLCARYEQPAQQLKSLMWAYENYYYKDCRSQPVRAGKAIALLEGAPALVAALERLLPGLKPVYAQNTLRVCRENALNFDGYARTVRQRFPQMDETQSSRLEGALSQFARLCEGLAAKLEAFLETTDLSAAITDESVLKIDRQVYADFLMTTHGVDLDELLEWHESEIEKTRAAVFDIVRGLDIPESHVKTMGEVYDILVKYAGPADTAEEMLERGRKYIQRTQAAAREFVRLPQEKCEVIPVMEILKQSYPWGGYLGGCARQRPIKGAMFLNTYNFKAVTDGWIKMNTVHEAYPGHHVQFVRTTLDPIPETVKRGAKYTPILEGTAHRSEKLFEFVFAEDPYFPLFVAYRRHHTAVRIKADLMLRYFGNPIKEVVQLYVDEMGFDWDTACGQVKAQENDLGYFTTYYYGYKKLSQWEQESGMDPKQYTELLFAAGYISLENFKRLLDLDEADRASFLHDFASLIQFDENYNERPIALD